MLTRTFSSSSRPLLPSRRGGRLGGARRGGEGRCVPHPRCHQKHPQRRAPIPPSATAVAAASVSAAAAAGTAALPQLLLLRGFAQRFGFALLAEDVFPLDWSAWGKSTSIIQGAPHGATLWLVTTCALSIALGALFYNLFSVMDVMKRVSSTGAKEEDRMILWGVDVTRSRFFRHPKVLEAVQFAAEAHAGQMRKTGEPYVSHCIETAIIVEHNLPPGVHYERYVPIMIAALLHDVIDDTTVDLDAIQACFGKVVAHMVGKVSKLSQMNQLLRRGKRKGWAEYSPQHFQSLRKMIVDMVFEEPLVILIKLADRLHNMRTVFVLKREKQCSVAEETLEVWCTMAECLGWDALKSEMEDLCFAALEPDKYCALRAHLDRMWNLPTLRVVEEQANNSRLPANAMDPAPPLTIRARRAADAAAARRSLAASTSAAGGSTRSRRPSPPPSSREISKATAAAATVIKDSATAPGPRAGMPPLTDMAGSLTNTAVKELGPPRSPSRSPPRSRDLGIRIVPPSEGADDLDWQGAAAAAAQAAGPSSEALLREQAQRSGTREQQPQRGGTLPPLVTAASDATMAVDAAPVGAVRQRGGRGSSAAVSGSAVANEGGGRGGSGGRSSRGTAAVADAPAAPPVPGSARDRGWERMFVQGLPGEDDPQRVCADNSKRRSSSSGVSAARSTTGAASVSGHRQGGYVLYTEAMLRGDVPPPARCSACQLAQQQEQQESAQGLGREASYSGFEHTMNHLLHSHRQSTLQSTLSQPHNTQAHNAQPQSAHQHHQHQCHTQQARPSKSLLPSFSLPSSLTSHLPFFSRKAPPLSTSADTPTSTSLNDTTSIPGNTRLGALQQQQQQQRGTTPKPLSLQQECLRALVSTVVPFDSVNFKNTKSLSNSTRRGLEVLDQCAEVLFSEVMLRSSGGGLGLSIEGRLKSLHSVYRKMVRKGCSIAEVFDARALRVIVDDEGGSRSRDAVETCYKLVSTVHSIWKPVPHEFDDYVANPKPSGYQALHTAVKGPGGIPMEVQIKTSSMHELAEYGAAAHFVYKESTNTTPTESAPQGATRPSTPRALPLPLPLPMEGPPSAAPSQTSDARGPINPRSGSTALFGQVACKVSQALHLPQRSPHQQASKPQQGHPADSTSGSTTTQQQQQQQQQQVHPAQVIGPRWVGMQTTCDSYTEDFAGGGDQIAASAVSSSSSSGSSWGVELYGPGSIAASAAAAQQQQQGGVQGEGGGNGAGVGDAAGASPLASLQAESSGDLDDDQGTAAGAPPPIFRGRGWVGQPVLRIAKDKLRYGVIVGNSGGGKRLLVAVKLGPTHPLYPTRVPDYSFYNALQEHVREKAWNTPGRGDLVLRLEEFVLSNNGRFHRKDHMGYVLPAETLTLLEGYEEEAEALARSAQHLKLQQLLLSRPRQQQLQLQQQLQQQQQQQQQQVVQAQQQQQQQEQQEQQQREELAQGQQQGYRGSAASLTERVREENASRFRRQMQEAHLRTMQLRKAIEWGRVAIGRYTPAGRAPSSEVAVLIWPGGSIEHWPRGTTVAEVVRFKGIPSPHEPRDVRASATSIAGGEDPGWLVRNGTFAGARYNVNNRLVPESTVLNDGDLVILTGEKVKI